MCIKCHKDWVTKNPRTGKKNYHKFQKVVNWEEEVKKPDFDRVAREQGYVKLSDQKKQ